MIGEMPDNATEPLGVHSRGLFDEYQGGLAVDLDL